MIDSPSVSVVVEISEPNYHRLRIFLESEAAWDFDRVFDEALLLFLSRSTKTSSRQPDKRSLA
jgi:hypothetical protein